MNFSNWHIFVVTFFILTCMISSSEEQLKVRIYTNLAEIIQPVRKLPLEFSTNDWYDIPSGSITLGTNLTSISQSIIQKRKSLNRAQVYIRSPIITSTTARPLIKATIVDDIVKI